MSEAPAARREVLAAHPQHLALAGLVAGLLLAPLPAGVAVLAALVLGCGAARLEPRVLPLLVTALCVGGSVLGDLRLDALERTALGPLYGRMVTEVVEVMEPPRSGPYGATTAVRLRGEPVLLGLPASSLRGDGPAVGDLLRVSGRLNAPSGFERARRAQGRLRARTAVPAGHRRGWRGAVDGARVRAQAALAYRLPAPEAALLRGMVLGDDSALPDERRDELRAAGLGHLVAASGQNIALLVALVAIAGAVLGVPLRARLLVMLGLIALYVPLAGGGPSIQRAGLMGGAALVAVLAGRAADRWYALGLAAAGTLVLDPRSAADPGWQLSFAAVLGLLVLAPRWREALRGRGVHRGPAEAIALTAAATLATAPVAALHFGTVSLAALPANVLATVAVAPITWLGMLAALAGQLHPVAALPLLALAAPLLGFVLLVGETAAALPYATVTPAIGVAVAASVAALLSRRRALVLAVVVAVAVATWMRRPDVPPPPERLRVTFLDVGQGDATLLQDATANVLVDTGVPTSPILQRLEHAGVDRLHLLVLTHVDADHAGAAPAVLDELEVDQVLDGRDGVPSPLDRPIERALRREGARTTQAVAGQRLTVGSMTFDVLWPQAEPPARHAGADPNLRATVLQVTAHGERLLLPADAESEVLGPLALEPADVLKVSHHGSADPGLPRLLQRLTPQLAAIEVGEDNTYGHPAPSTLEALEAVPTTVRTDRDGTVRADLDAQGRWRLTHGG